MSNSKRNNLDRQTSLSSIEQSLKFVPEPPQEPVTICYGPKACNMNLSKADIEIANRLENLRKRNKDIPSEEEMASRLARLKGLPDDHYRRSNSAAFYNPPDTRADSQKSDDLLKQVMEEVTLDTQFAKKCTGDIEKRLSRLRGNVPGGANETTVPPVLSVPPAITPIEENKDVLDFDEIEKLMKESQAEMTDAASSLDKLYKDPKISQAIKLSKNRPSKSGDLPTSDSDKYSDSDEDVGVSAPDRGDRVDPLSSNDQKEVDRIVQLYTQKAEEKKRKKKLKKSTESDQDIDSSLSSDLSEDISTSDSEKFSSDSE